MLRDAGFEEVTADDRTDQVRNEMLFSCSRFNLLRSFIPKLSLCFFLVLQFIAVLQRELNAVEKDKNEFISDFSEVSFSPSFLMLH